MKTNKEIFINKISNIIELIKENSLITNLKNKENKNEENFEDKFKKEIEGKTKVIYDNNNKNFEIPFNLVRDNSLITFKIENSLNDEENYSSNYEKFFNEDNEKNINNNSKNKTIETKRKKNSFSIEKKK